MILIHKTGNQGLQNQRHLGLKVVIYGKQRIAQRRKGVSHRACVAHCHTSLSLKQRDIQAEERTCYLLLKSQPVSLLARISNCFSTKSDQHTTLAASDFF